MGLAAPTPVGVPVGKPKKAPLSGAERRYDRSVWLFLGPAGLLMIIFLVIPTIYTFLLSFNRGRRGDFTEWKGLDNYAQLFQDSSFLVAIKNNILWAIFYVGLVIFFGLLVAVIAQRVRYEALIKAIVFLPMAIAATALAVIWNLMYAPDPDVGLLNAIASPFTGVISWLGDPDIVNWALIAAGIWGSVGFATVILSAALKGIPAEIIEAAHVDGANEFQIFWRIIVPLVSLPMSVLAVTLVVNVIKLFDLIFVLTKGGPGVSSRVVAFNMYQEAFPGGLFGKGAAVAVVMLLMLIPIMAYNIRRFRSERVV